MTAVDADYELDRGSPVYALVERFTQAIARRTGRPSRWNQTVRIDTNPDPDAVGFAQEDGTMTLNQYRVVEPLLKAESGEPLTEHDLRWLHDAAATIAHEAEHLDNRDGYEPDGHPVDDPPAVALDEGLVELWTRDNLDDLLHETGLAARVPDLVGRDTIDAYPAYTSATEELLVRLGPMTGMRPEELADELLATDISQRWNRIAELAIDHELPDLPGDERAEARAGLANSLRLQFSAAQQIQEDGNRRPAQKVVEGRHVGIRTGNLFEAEIDQIRNRVDRERVETERPSDLASWAEPGLGHAARAEPPSAPPGFAPNSATERVLDHGQGAAEVQRLNRFLSAQPSAAQAPGFKRPGSSRTAGATSEGGRTEEPRTEQPRTAGARPGGARPESARSDGSRPETTRSGAGRGPSRTQNGRTGPRRG